MKSKLKLIVPIAILLVASVLSFAFPRTKYVGTDFISSLNVPYVFDEWQGKDVTEQLNINTAASRFNFVNDAMANQYIHSNGANLLFIVLDAGNFHHPKVCFTGAGYKITELPDTVFRTSDRSFKAHTLFTERGRESFLSFYWIVIDKNIAHQWIEQKLKQLFFSMLNKERIGLMVRIDVPATEPRIDEAMLTARRFVNDLSVTLASEHKDYILGKQ